MVSAIGAEERTEVSVPLLPHIKKFIFKKYHLFDPITPTENSALGRSLSLALKDNRVRIRPKAADKFTESMTLVLTSDQIGLRPETKKLMRINHAMDDVFKEHLVTWIAGQMRAGVSAYAACKTFLSFYGINDQEYSVRAAYRFWLRSRS